jgi:hypothetical protein
MKVVDLLIYRGSKNLRLIVHELGEDCKKSG